MTDSTEDSSGGPYRVARTVGGLVLLGTAAFVWAIRDAGNVDTGQLLLMVGTGGVLLGVDVVKRILR